MTVSEFLVLPGLPGLRLLAGAGGADRKIAAVTAVDTPDGAQRLKGGELVLTTGYMLGQQAITLPDFLRALQKAGAAGLGILEKRYLRSIPADVRALADELDLPLVSVPEQYDYPQLAAPVLAGQPGRGHPSPIYGPGHQRQQRAADSRNPQRLCGGALRLLEHLF